MGWLDRLSRPSSRGGLKLDHSEGVWELTSSLTFTSFLKALDGWAPEGAVLYLEGGSPDSEIRSVLNAYATTEHEHVTPGTIWPRFETHHIPILGDALQVLSQTMERHADAELAIHLMVYRDGAVLLSWHDAPFDPLLMPTALPEEMVDDLAIRLGGSLRRVV